MTINIRSFTLEITSDYLFVRLPFIGQLILGPSVGGQGEWVVFDSWETVARETGRGIDWEKLGSTLAPKGLEKQAV